MCEEAFSLVRLLTTSISGSLAKGLEISRSHGAGFVWGQARVGQLHRNWPRRSDLSASPGFSAFSLFSTPGVMASQRHFQWPGQAGDPVVIWDVCDLLLSHIQTPLGGSLSFSLLLNAHQNPGIPEAGLPVLYCAPATSTLLAKCGRRFINE